MDLRPVASRLAQISHRLLLRILLTGGATLVLLGVAAAALTFGLDVWLKLPAAVRGVLLILGTGTAVVLGFRHLVRPLFKKPDLEDLALVAEEADPAIKDQIISALQLEKDLAAGRAVESPEMIRALIEDTVARYGQRSFGDAVSLKPCAKPALAAAVALGALVFCAANWPEHARIWFERQILLRNTPWPQRNTLVVTILDVEKFAPKSDGQTTVLHVPERTPLQITVSAADGKVLPDEVVLVTEPLDEAGEDQPISMGRVPGKPFFQHIFPPLLRSIAFHAEGGDDDDELPRYEIRVARAPRVVRFYADYDYPDYTGLEDKSQSDANISAPEGTRVTMHFEVNMALASFDLDFEHGGAIQPTKKADGSYTHAFTVQGNDFYSFRLKGDNGVAALDAPRYVVTCELDQAPRIAVEMPASNSLFVTPEAIIPLKGLVTDDHGVTEIGLRYGVGGTQGLEWGARIFGGDEILAASGSRQLSWFVPLPLTALEIAAKPATEKDAATPARPVAEGDRFSFRFLAVDNRRTAANPEPHRVFGDYEFQVQVLSSRDLQRELAQRQVRLRERVRDIANLIDARIADTQALLAAVRSEGDAEQLRSRFWTIEQDQNRISIELQTSSKQFQRVYDGYLWNRVDKGFLTEKLIEVLVGLYRRNTGADSGQIYGEALESVRSQIDEGELMGRLTVILDLFLRTSLTRSPEAYRRLARAALVTAPEERVLNLQDALEMQKLLREDVLVLADKLEAWEDYLDIVQRARDIHESQQSTLKRIEKLTK